MKNFTLHARDGDLGRSKDFLFDDEKWTLRYMEASTARVLGRRVLISPISMGEPNVEAREIPVKLSRKEIEDAPGAETDQPISERFEREYYAYFGYPYYWVGGDVWGLHGYPADLLQQASPGQEPPDERKIRESHLRSMHEVIGYRIHAADGEIGHVADFVLDSRNWAVRYLVVDVRRWLPGPSVMLAPQWIEKVSWHEKLVYVDVARSAIKDAPRFEMPISRDDELAVFSHFSRQPYWHTGTRQQHEADRRPGGHSQ
ncbi:PRC-barrel domain-containing protein [Gilvimarinus sp. F26214L]